MKNNFLKKILKSDYSIDVSKLVSATTIAQLITILTAPILYRIYDKVDYGSLAVYMAITGVIGVVGSLQYLNVVLIEKKDSDAINAIWLNRVINFTFSLLCLLVLYIFKTPIYKALDNSTLEKFIWFAPITIFLGTQNGILVLWANRKKEYNLIVINSVITALSVPIISISVGLYNNSALGLFLGLFASQTLPYIVLNFGLNRKYNLGLKKINLSTIKFLVKKHIDFPKYVMPSEFINRFTNQLPVLAINYFLGPAQVGVYSLAQRMLGLPIQFLGSAIGTVFQQKATSDYNTAGNCRNVFLKTAKILFAISIVPFIAILIFGPELFSFFFGPKWLESGSISRLLVPLFFGKLIVSPLSFMFHLTGRQKQTFYWHIWMLISNLLIFLVLFKTTLNLELVILIYSLNYFVIYLFYFYKSYTFTIDKKFKTL